MSRLLEQLRPELDATGLPWTTYAGTKHLKLYVGARMVGILPLKGRAPERSRRAFQNTVAQIRRAARELQ